MNINNCCNLINYIRLNTNENKEGIKEENKIDIGNPIIAFGRKFYPINLIKENSEPFFLLVSETTKIAYYFLNQPKMESNLQASILEKMNSYVPADEKASFRNIEKEDIQVCASAALLLTCIADIDSKKNLEKKAIDYFSKTKPTFCFASLNQASHLTEELKKQKIHEIALHLIENDKEVKNIGNFPIKTMTPILMDLIKELWSHIDMNPQNIEILENMEYEKKTFYTIRESLGLVILEAIQQHVKIPLFIELYSKILKKKKITQEQILSTTPEEQDILFTLAFRSHQYHYIHQPPKTPVNIQECSNEYIWIDNHHRNPNQQFVGANPQLPLRKQREEFASKIFTVLKRQFQLGFRNITVWTTASENAIQLSQSYIDTWVNKEHPEKPSGDSHIQIRSLTTLRVSGIPCEQLIREFMKDMVVDKIFTDKEQLTAENEVPLYSAVDGLKEVITLVQLQFFKHVYVSDFDIPPFTPNELYDEQTLRCLNNKGVVLPKRMPSFAGYENGCILSKNNPKSIEIHRFVLETGLTKIMLLNFFARKGRQFTTIQQAFFSAYRNVKDGLPTKPMNIPESKFGKNEYIAEANKRREDLVRPLLSKFL